jgi:mono/diheme cytochrome c family protein
MIIKFIGSQMPRPRPTPPRPLLRLARATLLAAAAATAACASSLPAPSQDDATRAAVEWPGTTVETLARGQRTYLDHCSSCHAPYRPDAQSASVWRKIVPKMALRSKLDRQSTDDVVRYLVAFARR